MTLARLIGSKLSKNAGVRAELEARSESGDLGWALFTGGGHSSGRAVVELHFGSEAWECGDRAGRS